MVPVYYCPCYPFNTVSSGDLKVYSWFQKVASESLEHCDFVDLQGSSWRSPYQTHNNLNYLQIDIVKVSPQRDRNIVVPTFCSPFKNNLSQLSAKTDAAEKGRTYGIDSLNLSDTVHEADNDSIHGEGNAYGHDSK